MDIDGGADVANTSQRSGGYTYTTSNDLYKNIRVVQGEWKLPDITQSWDYSARVTSMGLGRIHMLPTTIADDQNRILLEIAFRNDRVEKCEPVDCCEARSNWGLIAEEDVAAISDISKQGAIPKKKCSENLDHLFTASYTQEGYMVSKTKDRKFMIILELLAALSSPEHPNRIFRGLVRLANESYQGNLAVNWAAVLHKYISARCKALKPGSKTFVLPLLFAVYERKNWLTPEEFRYYDTCRSQISVQSSVPDRIDRSLEIRVESDEIRGGVPLVSGEAGSNAGGVSEHIVTTNVSTRLTSLKRKARETIASPTEHFPPTIEARETIASPPEHFPPTIEARETIASPTKHFPPTIDPANEVSDHCTEHTDTDRSIEETDNCMDVPGPSLLPEASSAEASNLGDHMKQFRSEYQEIAGTVYDQITARVTRWERSRVTRWERSRTAEVDSLRGQIDELKRQQEVYRNQATQWKDDAGRATTNERGALEKLRSQEEQLLILQGQVSVQTELISELRSSASTLRSTVDRQQKDLDDFAEREKRMNDQLQEREESRDELEGWLSGLQSRIKDLEEEGQQEIREQGRQQSEESGLNDQLNELRSKLGEVQKEKDKMDGVNSELRQRVQTLQNLEVDLREFNILFGSIEIARRERDFAKMESSFRAKEKTEIISLRREVRERSEKIRALEKKGEIQSNPTPR